MSSDRHPKGELAAQFFLIEAFDVGDRRGNRAGEASVIAIVFDLGGLARLTTEPQQIRVSTFIIGINDEGV